MTNNQTVLTGLPSETQGSITTAPAVTDAGLAAVAASTHHRQESIFSPEVLARVAVLEAIASKRTQEQQDKLLSLTKDIAKEMRTIVADDFDDFTSCLRLPKSAVYDALIKNGQATNYLDAVRYVAHGLIDDKGRLPLPLNKKIEDFLELYYSQSSRYS